MSQKTKSLSRFVPSVLAICGLIVLVADNATAASVSIVFGHKAPEIERYAAQELAAQFRQLFKDVEVAVGTQPVADTTHVVLLGSPTTNSHVDQAAGSDWPQMSDQGLVLRSLVMGGKPTLIVGGGSPSATLWSAYELGHRYGIRYLFRGDIVPLEKQPIDIGGHDVVMEPELRSRTWRTINDFAMGPESWGLQEHEKFLRQLAKMKFNRLMLSVYPWHPFVQYEFRGVAKQTSVLWWGNVYPVDGDTVGKKVFLGQKRFENPDFAGLSTPKEMTRAGIAHLRGLIAAAHKLGMSVGISISPLEFPREFQSVLPGSRVGRGLRDLTIVPAAEQGPRDEVLRKLVATKIRAYLETYPTIDELYLTLPEFPEWDQHADEAMRLLNDRGILTDWSVEQLVDSAAQRKLIASGERGEQAIRGNLVGLAFLHETLADDRLLLRADGTPVDLTITGIDPALFPLLDEVVPAGTATLNFVDYTARRVVENRHLLDKLPAERVRSQLIMTLADDNVGILPQSSMQSMGILMEHLKEHGWDGFSTRYWVPGELDPAVYFLSRAAWQRELTPRAAHNELWTTTTGNGAAAERLWIGWQHLETATNLIDSHDLGFAFPVDGMLMRHYVPEPIPDWWQEATDAYTEFMIELYRSQGAINGGAAPLLFYYAKRGEYVLEYLAAVKAVREAAIANEAGDAETAIEHLEQALEQTFNCINTLADVAQDQSDRGLIAMLNQYAYRPLLAEYEKLAE